MPENVQININAKDNASPQIKKIGANLKEMGANVSQVGMKLSAAFTLPIVGMAALILKSKEVQAVLAPVKEEFTKLGEQLGIAFVPLIKEAVPLLMQFARTLSSVITWFSNLDPVTKKVIIGFVGFVAGLGPVIVIIGQVMTTVGSMVTLLSSPVVASALASFGIAFGAVILPVLALAAAIAFLVKVISDNWSTIQKGAAVIAHFFTGKLPDWAFNIKESNGPLTVSNWGKASGGSVARGMAYNVGEMGREIFRPQQSGNILPAGAGGNGGGATVINFSYSPTIGIGSEDEIYKIAYRLDQALRRRR